MDGLDASILDALSDALFVVRDERIVWINAAAAKLLGSTELVGRPFDEILAPGERRRLALLEEQRKGGWNLPATCRIRFVRPTSGAEVTADLRFGQRDQSLIVCARDLTEVTRAEALMGSLAQMSARGSVLLDADAVLDGAEPIFEELGWKVAFTEIFPSGSVTRRMLAAPVGDPVGDYGRSIVGTPLPFDKTPVLAEVVRTGRPIFLDNLPTLLSGPERAATELGASMERAHVIRSAWCPVLTNGKLTHLLAVTGRDLTEHDFVAVQLFAAQIGAAIHMQHLRAELVHHERLAAVGEMAAVMAHEVRNPLGIIFNALSALRKPQAAKVATAELYDIIQEEGERLRRLVTDLLDFARPSAIELDTVAVEPLVRQAAEAARLDPSCPAAPNPIAVDMHVDDRIETDPMLFRRALVNLLVNALQYVSADGCVSVVGRLADGELHIRVHDDGAPMAPEVAARVFEPFFTTRAAGTGLGLAIVRRIIEDLGGKIALETAGEGTTFSIRLPARARHSGAPLPKSSHRGAHTG
jgi:signal transduction histidine kinase